MAAGFDELFEPEDIGLRLSPGMCDGGVSSALMLEWECWPLATVGRPDDDSGPPNLVISGFVGSSRGPGRLFVAVLLEVRLDPPWEAESGIIAA